MTERRPPAARTLIVCLDGTGNRDDAAAREEAVNLAAALSLDIREVLGFRVRAPRPATLFGSGQVEQIASAARRHEAELVIVDHALTPVQQSNLEKALAAKVIDRTGLILEIFGERAATAEGRLQVELAHLDYQAGRLVRSWTHLERQRGGFGFLGGPGETQIEADRRMIRDRMAKIRRELEQVVRTRALHRHRRQRAPWPTIALVGYTNAGKSTLFNRLTQAEVLAQDMLFATLDPTMREIRLPGVGKAILSDTVGFVSRLPTQLVAAFRATLEEVLTADLIVHVRDIASDDREAQAEDVAGVLAELGIGPERPLIEVWNKLDRLDAEARADVEAQARGRDDVAVVSAISGEGVAGLREMLAQRLTTGHRVRRITVIAGDGEGLAWLHRHGEVLSRTDSEDGTEAEVEVRIGDDAWYRFLRAQDERFAASHNASSASSD